MKSNSSSVLIGGSQIAAQRDHSRHRRRRRWLRAALEHSLERFDIEHVGVERDGARLGEARVWARRASPMSANQSNVAMQAVCESLGFVRRGVIENLDESDHEIIYRKRLRQGMMSESNELVISPRVAATPLDSLKTWTADGGRCRDCELVFFAPAFRLMAC